MVFVHGLGGDQLKTWRAGKGKDISWPHWIGQDFPEVGIWSLEYAATPSTLARMLRWLPGWGDAGHAMSLTDRAVEVLNQLVACGIGQRPLMFICHSLGGLVIKQVLRAASDAAPQSEHRAIFSNTRAVMFLATPHQGATLATFLQQIPITFPTIAMKDLGVENPYLRNLLDWYRNHVEPAGIHTRTFFESRPYRGVLIVEARSAHPGVGEDPVPLDEDHISIAKPRDRKSLVYSSASDVLRKYVLTPARPPGAGGTATATNRTSSGHDAALGAGVTHAPFSSAFTRFAETAFANHLDILSTEISDTASTELERFQSAWRGGRRQDVRSWLGSLTRSQATLAAMDHAVAARVLRFAAAIAIDEHEDPVQVRAWLDQATVLDPKGDDVRLRAALIARGGDREAAMELLAASPTPGAQNLRAALLIEAGNLDEAENILDAVGGIEGRDLAETWRFRAHIRFGRHDLAGATTAAAEAQRHASNQFVGRLLCAILQYYEGFFPDALPSAVPPWPEPSDSVFIRRDAAAIGAFEAAAQAFADLLDLDLTALERRQIEAWRLAALSNVDIFREHAAEFATDVLLRDPAHPYVLLWSAHLDLQRDLDASFDALDHELTSTFDLEHASAFIKACLTTDRALLAAQRLDQWRPRFAEAGELSTWAVWRAQAAGLIRDFDRVRELLPEMPDVPARGLEASLLANAARRSGDAEPLLAHLEASAEATGNPSFLLNACQWQASAGQWEYVRQHIDTVLERLPSPEVVRLAIYARYNTGDFAGCITLLDEALAQPQEAGNRIELLRMRASARESLGQITGAMEDMKEVVARGGDEPTTRDLMSLAQLYFLAGQVHEVAGCARKLRGRADLTAMEALGLVQALADDDKRLACELWHVAERRGIPDDAVTAAMGLGFKLSLDDHLGELVRRMSELADEGHPSVRKFATDDLSDLQEEWVEQRHRTMEQYRRGEAPTHVVAQILNLPLVHLYHVMLSANESQPVLRQQFALQIRDGARGVPDPDDNVDLPRRIALDLSALLLAAHLDLLPLIEQEFASVLLPHHIIAALHQERDKLKPHQPSQLEVNQKLLQAERQGLIRRWDGELPVLDADEMATADHWSRWLALFERARREQAFVLDLPLASEPHHGRPVTMVGPERMARLLTPATLRTLLQGGGVEVPAADPTGDIQENHPDGQVSLSASEVPARSVLYLTDAGAKALVSAGLLAAAAEYFVLMVDPDDQDTRRAHLEVLPELDQQVSWVEAIIHRISDGLEHGRYELLPVSRADDAGDEPAVDEGDHAVEADSDKSEPAETPPAAASQGRGRRLPLPLTFITDLMLLPPGKVDAVWIEDRWLNRHSMVGTARVIDVLELLALLEAKGKLSPDDRWALVLKLRAANVRILPLSSQEILHHLRKAQVSGGRLRENRALRVIRQSAAALIEDAGALRIPPPEFLARGDVGELNVIATYARAVQDSIVELWRDSGDLTDVAIRSCVEAQSSWIVDNLFIDTGLLRARVVHPESPPQPGVSAKSAALLVCSLMQLLSKGDDEQTDTDDLRARMYAQWVYDELIASRATRDPEFRQAMLQCLGTYLKIEQISDSGNPIVLVGARLLARRVFDALPEPVRAELASNSELMEYVGSAFVTSMALGRWNISVADFATAGAKAVRGDTAQIPVLGSDPPMSMVLTYTPSDGFRLQPPDGASPFSLQDPAFCVLAAVEVDRQKGIAAFRSVADVSAERWHGEAERLAALDDPVVCLTTLMKYRQDSVSERYRTMIGRWRTNRRFGAEDLSPPNPDAVLAHLRFLAGDVEVVGWASVWESATETVINEEGPDEALLRLAGLPLPVPEAMLGNLLGLGSGERRALVKRLLGVPTSPFGLIQAIRVLAVLGNREPVYGRLAQRLAHRLLSPSWQTEVKLLRIVANKAYEELQARDSANGSTGAFLITSWYHAHRFVSAIHAFGGDLALAVEAVAAQSRPITGSVFDAGRDENRDVAHPSHVQAIRLTLAGLQYASTGTGLLNGSGRLIVEVADHFVQPTSTVPIPDIELLRDTGSLTNTLGTWLAPTRTPDGAYMLGPISVVPETWSPTVLRSNALGSLHADPFDPNPWIVFAMVDGRNALTGSDAESFDAAIANVDIVELVQRVRSETNESLVMGRLAIQALEAGSLERRDQLRTALLSAVVADRKSREKGSGSKEPVATDRQGMSEMQLGALEALCLLSLGESGRIEAMTTFAKDLANVGRADSSFLWRSRGFLEKFVTDLPLAEAHVFTSLLAEARGSS